jgi:hypothetical protein
MRIFRHAKWIAMLVLLGACAGQHGRFDSPYASGRYVDAPVQCVPYARQVSGVQIRGDAHSWWHQAAPRYSQGNVPEPGAVLVLAKTGKLRHGHLAVVRRVIGPRHIDVTHSNWGNDNASRSMIYDSMRAEDVSARNDWSRVRFWNYHIDAFGLPYSALGFIYP